MTWCDLLFAHWEIDPAAVRPLIPEPLELDTFDGKAYIAAVPFRMESVRPRLFPSLPGLDSFPELNLRTYVKTGAKPGVWFFSLDAGQKLAVRTARRFFYLPYFDARFQIENAGEEIRYACQRTHRNQPKSEFIATYRPTGEPYFAKYGSLEEWLTGRYCLYARDSMNNVYRGEVNHRPWPLQQATAEVHLNTLGDWLNLKMNGQPDILHFAKSLAVHAWPISLVSA